MQLEIPDTNESKEDLSKMDNQASEVEEDGMEFPKVGNMKKADKEDDDIDPFLQNQMKMQTSPNIPGLKGKAKTNKHINLDMVDDEIEDE